MVLFESYQICCGSFVKVKIPLLTPWQQVKLEMFLVFVLKIEKRCVYIFISYCDNIFRIRTINRYTFPEFRINNSILMCDCQRVCTVTKYYWKYVGSMDFRFKLWIENIFATAWNCLIPLMECVQQSSRSLSGTCQTGLKITTKSGEHFFFNFVFFM